MYSRVTGECVPSECCKMNERVHLSANRLYNKTLNLTQATITGTHSTQISTLLQTSTTTLMIGNPQTLKCCQGNSISAEEYLLKIVCLITRPASAQLYAVFTSLHGMQTRYSDGNSVCPSVRPSNAWIVTKRKKAVFRFSYHSKEHLS